MRVGVDENALPAAAVHDVVEGPPLGVLDRRKRPVGRAAERQQRGATVAVGNPEQSPEQILIADRGVTAPDPHVGGGDRHLERQLPQVVLDEPAPPFVLQRPV